MTRILKPVLLTLGLLALAVDWVMMGSWPVGLTLLILTPLSLYLVIKDIPYALSGILLLSAIAGSAGLFFKMDFSIVLVGWLLILAAWDLDGFSRRLEFASTEDNPSRLENNHLARMALTLLSGAAFSLAVRSFQVTLRFELTVVLVIMAFVGLGLLINWLRKKES